MQFVTTISLAAACMALPAQQDQRAQTALDLEAANAYSEENAGLALLVYRGSELIFEAYHNGHDHYDYDCDYHYDSDLNTFFL